MDTNFGRFRMLALRTTAGVEVKDDVNNATLSLKRSSMTFCMCVCLYDYNQICTEETALKHFVPSFVSPSHFNTHLVKCFTLVLWRNVS